MAGSSMKTAAAKSGSGKKAGAGGGGGSPDSRKSMKSRRLMRARVREAGIGGGRRRGVLMVRQARVRCDSSNLRRCGALL